jgi:release factor glutamine methyltransferase
VSDDVRAFVDDATRRLATAGVPSARHDAEVLLAFVLGTTRAGLRTRATPLRASDRAEADALVSRRAAREPLQHLTGVAGFRHLDIEVGPGVFVPRPETEILAGEAIEELSRLVASGVEHPVAVDLCTGSGAVAASLASEVPRASVTAVEVSEPAYEFAVRNAAPFGVDVRLGDMSDAVDDLAERVHVVSANPPYIPLDAFESVEPEARDHDPAQALWSGQDGLDAIRVVADVAARLLVDGGLLLCEHADVQHESAPAVFSGLPAWHTVRDHLDLAGRPRFVTARRVARRRPRAGTIAL